VKHLSGWLLGIVLAVLLLGACAARPTPTPDTKATEVAMVANVVASLTASAPTATPTPQPTLTPSPSSTPTPAPTMTATWTPVPLVVPAGWVSTSSSGKEFSLVHPVDWKAKTPDASQIALTSLDGEYAVTVIIGNSPVCNLDSSPAALCLPCVSDWSLARVKEGCPQCTITSMGTGVKSTGGRDWAYSTQL
jgi:hypothetical protein